jgi:hypothetical protein
MAQQHPMTEKRTPSIFDSEIVSEWLALHLKNILYGVAAGIVILMALYFFIFKKAQLSERQYQKAVNDFVVFSRPDTTDAAAQAEALKSLQELMAKHADLQAAYGGAIAQTLINRGDVTDALPLAKQTLKRTAADNLPLYQEYAQTTLLILEEKYADALKNAQALQKTMNNEVKTIATWEQRSFSPELFPLNLFRVAMLQQQLGDKAGEKATWKLWSQYAGITTPDAELLPVDARAFHLIIQQLAIGSSSIPDYIKERLNQ